MSNTTYYLPVTHWEIEHCAERRDHDRVALTAVKYEDRRAIVTDGRKMIIAEVWPDPALVDRCIRPRDSVRMRRELRTSASGGDVTEADIEFIDSGRFPNWRGVIPEVSDDAIAIAITPKHLNDLARALNPSRNNRASMDRPLTLVLQKGTAGGAPLLVVMGEDSDRIGLLATCTLPDGASAETSRAQRLLGKLSARSVRQGSGASSATNTETTI